MHHRGLQTVLLEQYDSDTVARLAKVCARASNTASNHQMIELGGILPYFNNIPKGAPYRNVESYLLPKFFAENSARRLALTSYLSFHRNDIDAVNDSAALTERASQFNAFAGRVAATYAGKVVLKVGFQLEDTVDQATAETLLTQIAGQFTFNPAAVAFKLVRCPSGDVDSADRGVTSQLRATNICATIFLCIRIEPTAHFDC